MEAQVSYRPPPEDLDDDWDENAPWMIRPPVEVEVTLPRDVPYPPEPPPLPEPEPVDPEPHRPSAASGPGAFSLPPGTPGRRRKRPITLRALQSPGLHETPGQMTGGRPGLPPLPGLVPAADAPDGAGDTDNNPDELPTVARLSGGGAGGGTGRRALDAAVAAGPIPGLDRILQQPPRSTGPRRRHRGHR